MVFVIGVIIANVGMMGSFIISIIQFREIGRLREHAARAMQRLKKYEDHFGKLP